jgi:hypothetical protein
MIVVAEIDSSFSEMFDPDGPVTNSQAKFVIKLDPAALISADLSTIRLSVYVLSSTGRVSRKQNITVYQQPILLSLDLASGQNGDVVQIAGTHIPRSLPDPSLVLCRFGTIASPGLLDGNGGLSCQAPPQVSEGSKDVTVSFNGRDEAGGLSFTYFQLLGVSLDFGSNAGGSRLMLTVGGWAKTEAAPIFDYHFGEGSSSQASLVEGQFVCLTPPVAPFIGKTSIKLSATGGRSFAGQGRPQRSGRPGLGRDPPSEPPRQLPKSRGGG